jgi:hypothetical protein
VPRFISGAFCGCMRCSAMWQTLCACKQRAAASAALRHCIARCRRPTRLSVQHPLARRRQGGMTPWQQPAARGTARKCGDFPAAAARVAQRSPSKMVIVPCSGASIVSGTALAVVAAAALKTLRSACCSPAAAPPQLPSLITRGQLAISCPTLLLQQSTHALWHPLCVPPPPPCHNASPAPADEHAPQRLKYLCAQAAELPAVCAELHAQLLEREAKRRSASSSY